MSKHYIGWIMTRWKMPNVISGTLSAVFKPMWRQSTLFQAMAWCRQATITCNNVDQGVSRHVVAFCHNEWNSIGSDDIFLPAGQAITWNNIDQDPRHYMVTIEHDDFDKIIVVVLSQAPVTTLYAYMNTFWQEYCLFQRGVFRKTNVKIG